MMIDIAIDAAIMLLGFTAVVLLGTWIVNK